MASVRPLAVCHRPLGHQAADRDRIEWGRGYRIHGTRDVRSLPIERGGPPQREGSERRCGKKTIAPTVVLVLLVLRVDRVCGPVLSVFRLDNNEEDGGGAVVINRPQKRPSNSHIKGGSEVRLSV